MGRTTRKSKGPRRRKGIASASGKQPEQKTARFAEEATSQEKEAIEKMTVKELRKRLSEHGAETAGLKKDLIQRLQNVSGGGRERSEAEEEEVRVSLNRQSTLLKAADLVLAARTKAPLQQFPVDPHIIWAGHTGIKVVEDFSCTLTKCHVDRGVNDYTVLQLLRSEGNGPNKGVYGVWKRFGRVGHIQGRWMQGVFPKEKKKDAITAFENHYKQLTGKTWGEKTSYDETGTNFVPLKISRSGVGNVLEKEMGEPSAKWRKVEDGEKTPVEDEEQPGPSTPRFRKTRARKNQTAVTPKKTGNLDEATKTLIETIFDAQLFAQASHLHGIGGKKLGGGDSLPFGRLSKVQIAEGFEVLDKIRTAIRAKTKDTALLKKLTGEFFTIIPHEQGWLPLKPITDENEVQAKIDILCDLADIVFVQRLQEKEILKREKSKVVPDTAAEKAAMNYKLLECDLEPVTEDSDVYTWITKALTNQCNDQYVVVGNIWALNRHNKNPDFDAHKSIKDRRLLWHGTKTYLVAAILNSGLKIVPFGRKGIFHADDFAKSHGFADASNNQERFYFLNEVVLKTPKILPWGEGSWRDQTNKKHSTNIARGQKEPNPKDDKTIKIEGNDVIFATGANKIASHWKKKARHDFTEYISYEESLVRLRYLVQIIPKRKK